jgi:hypothetical protein
VTLLVERMVSERFHRDTEGRPLREGRTPAEHLREGDIEYRACPYAGSRHQHAHPMNVSALRQVGAHWDAIVGALGHLRGLHDRALGVGEPGIMDIWRTSQLGGALPWLYVFKGQEVPAWAAALAKVSLGVGIWAQRMLVRTIAEGWTPGPLTAARILELAEESGTLIGDTEVCAGGDKMMLAYFEVHVGPLHAPTTPLPDVSDRDVMNFGAHYAGFKLSLWLYYLARRFLYAERGAGDLLADLAVEPSDFFLVEPTDLAAVPPDQRGGWLRSLADLVVPFAPHASDLPLRDHAYALAQIMRRGLPTAETFALLDLLFARTVAQVESGLRGAVQMRDAVGERDVPEAVRDRLIGDPARARLGSRPISGPLVSP